MGLGKGIVKKVYIQHMGVFVCDLVYKRFYPFVQKIIEPHRRFICVSSISYKINPFLSPTSSYCKMLFNISMFYLYQRFYLSLLKVLVQDYE